MSVTPDEDAILADMLAKADQLCGHADLLMAGQYRFLAERIRAVIELRDALAPEEKSGP